MQKSKRKISLRAGACATALAIAMPSLAAGAVVATDSFNTGSANAFPVSATDLLNGLAPTATDFNANGYTGPLSVLTDGSAGPDSTNSADGVLDLSNSVFFEFTLPSTPDALGYLITGFELFAGHASDRVDLVDVTLSISVVGSSDFNTIFGPRTSDHPAGNLQDGSTTLSSTRLSVTDDTGFLATGVDAIRFSYNGNAVIREVDLLGAAVVVPEPGTGLLLGSLAASFLGLSRRRRA